MCRQLMVITVFIAFLNLLRKCLIPWVTVFVAAFPKIMGQSIIAGGALFRGMQLVSFVRMYKNGFISLLFIYANYA